MNLEYPDNIEEREGEENEEELEENGDELENSKKFQFPNSLNNLKSKFYEKGKGGKEIIKYLDQRSQKQENPIKIPHHNPLMRQNPYVGPNPNYQGLGFPPPFNNPNFNPNQQANNLHNKKEDIQRERDEKIKEFEEEANKLFGDGPKDKDFDLTEEFEEMEQNQRILFNNQLELYRTMVENNKQLYVQMMLIQWDLERMIENMIEQIEENTEKQIQPIEQDLAVFKQEISNKVNKLTEKKNNTNKRNIFPNKKLVSTNNDQISYPGNRQDIYNNAQKEINNNPANNQCHTAKTTNLSDF